MLPVIHYLLSNLQTHSLSGHQRQIEHIPNQYTYENLPRQPPRLHKPLSTEGLKGPAVIVRPRTAQGASPFPSV